MGLKGFQGDTEGYKRLHDVTNARYLVPRPYNSNLQFRWQEWSHKYSGICVSSCLGKMFCSVLNQTIPVSLIKTTTFYMTLKLVSSLKTALQTTFYVFKIGLQNCLNTLHMNETWMLKINPKKEKNNDIPKTPKEIRWQQLKTGNEHIEIVQQ